MENDKLIGELYENYKKYLLCIARQTSKANAEDIIHDVFLNLIESTKWLVQCILKADSPDEVKRILRTFMRNACINYHKHSNIGHNIFNDTYNTLDCELYAASTDVEQEYGEKNSIEYIINLINQLSERGKDIIIKYYIEGYSKNEIAEQMKLSIRTIDTYIYRILKRLREILKK
jgi:RNA polymerase sigma-70 factor (ECF subfamily)